jgi:hypothetical protein
MGVPLHGPIVLPKRNKTNAFFYHCARSSAAGEAGQHFNLSFTPPVFSTFLQMLFFLKLFWYGIHDRLAAIAVSKP